MRYRRVVLSMARVVMLFVWMLSPTCRVPSVLTVAVTLYVP